MISTLPGFPAAPQFAEPWTQARWFALHTRSRHEKIVAGELEKKGIEFFLPLRQITRQWSDRRKTIEDPLFKGYLFVHIPFREHLSILTTTGVVAFVGQRPAREPVAVSERELHIIRQFVEQKIQMDPFPYLHEGERVYVRSGPFQGAEGFIIRKSRHCRLIISLDLLMQSISIEIDSACVEPV